MVLAHPIKHSYIEANWCARAMIGTYGLCAKTDTLHTDTSDVLWVKVASNATTLGPYDLFLRPALSLRVKVVAKGTNIVLPGALVSSEPLTLEQITDEHGESVFQITPGVAIFKAEAKGYALMERFITLGLEKNVQEAEVVLALEPGATVWGRVLTPDGTAVPNAQVASLDGPTSQTRSDEQGVYHLKNLPLGVKIRLEARKLGYMSNWVKKNKALEQSQKLVERDLILTPIPKENSLHGWVTDEQGQPIDGARVSLSTFFEQESTVTRTRNDGYFVFEQVGKPSHFQIDAEGYASQRVFVDELEGDNFTLGKGFTVSGFLIDDRGRAINNALLKVDGEDYRLNAQTVAAGGQFKVSGLRSDARLIFTKVGYRGTIVRDLKPGQTDLKVVMARTGILAGTVVDADSGDPITAFQVKLEDVDSGRELADVQTTNGSFRLPGKAVGRSVEITISADHYGIGFFKVKSLHPDKLGTEIFKLSRSDARVAGVVRDKSGQPLAGIPLELQVAFPGRAFSNSLFDDEVMEKHMAKTANDGSFQFENLPHCNFALLLQAPGLAQDLVPNLTSRFGADLQHIQMVALPEAVIHGKVNLLRYQQANEVTVASPALHGSPIAIPTDGSFEVKQLKEGDYLVGIRDRENNALFVTNVKLHEGEERQLLIGFDDPIKINGTATIGGRLSNHATITLVDPGSFFQKKTSVPLAPDGSFVFDKVEPGDYLLNLAESTDEFPMPDAIPLTVTDTDVKGSWDFQPRGQVRGRIITDKKVEVLLNHQEALWTVRASTDEMGLFVIPEVTGGTYGLIADVGDRNIGLGVVEMPIAGPGLDLGEIDLSQGQGKLKIQLNGLDDGGATIVIELFPVNAQVLNASTLVTRHKETSDQGTILLKNLKEGMFKAKITCSDRAVAWDPEVTEVEISAEKTSIISLTAKPVTFVLVMVADMTALTAAHLINAQTSEKLECRQYSGGLDQLEYLSSGLWFGHFTALIKGVPEGDWHFRGSLKNGKIVEKDLKLQKGIMGQELLTPIDP